MGKKIFWLYFVWVFILGFAFGGIKAFAAEQKTIEWKCSVYGPDRVYFKPIHWFNNELEKRTNGRFKIKVYYGEVLSPTKKVFDGLKAGLFESGMGGAIYTPGATPLGGVPFTLGCLGPVKPSDQFRMTWDYNQHPLVKAELEKFDSMLFLPTTVGDCLYETYSNKPIQKLEDFKGLRIRDVPPTGVVWEKLGARIVSGTYAEIYEMASRNMVDAMLIEPLTATGFRLQEVFKYLTQGMSLKNAATYIYCNKKAFEALPKDIRDVYDNLIKEAPANFEEIWAVGTRDARAEINKAGVKWIPFPPEERVKLVKIFRQEVWPQQREFLDKKGLPSKEIFDYLVGLARKYGVVVPD